MAQIADSLAIGWRLSSVSGWGVYGTNLTLQLLAKGRTPCLLLPPHLLSVDTATEAILAPVLQRQEVLTGVLEKGTVGQLELDYPALFALRNGIQSGIDEQLVSGHPNIGVIFFEDTTLSEEALARANGYDLIITGSSWNERVLRDHGIQHVTTVFQGIDPDRFRPADTAPKDVERFVVFSGGKFEYRKGQDAVVAAFREFRARHDDAVLMFAWANQWTQVLSEIETAGLVTDVPALDASGNIDFAPWLMANGLPPDSFINLGMPANRDMSQHLAQADVALFPNRCEPGTNLVAMEAMACGIPAIISANTGQLDLINGENCYPLCQQGTVAPVPTYDGVDGWGEPDVGEIVQCLERAYEDRDDCQRRGTAGAEFIRQFTWSRQIDKLLAAIDGTLNPT